MLVPRLVLVRLVHRTSLCEHAALHTEITTQLYATHRTVEGMLHFFVDGLNNGRVWIDSSPSILAQFIFLPVMSLISQAFFGRRCWLLLGKLWWYPWALGTASCLTFALGVVAVGTMWKWCTADQALTIDELNVRFTVQRSPLTLSSLDGRPCPGTPNRFHRQDHVCCLDRLGDHR